MLSCSIVTYAVTFNCHLCCHAQVSLMLSRSSVTYAVMFNCHLCCHIQLSLMLSRSSVTYAVTFNCFSVMLVCICILFAVTTTPYALMYGVNSDVTTITYAVMFQLVYINHSANFIVYVISNKRYVAVVITKDGWFCLKKARIRVISC